MPLIECQECGAKVSDKAGACVKCGCPLSSGGGGRSTEENPDTESTTEGGAKSRKALKIGGIGCAAVVVLLVLLGIVGWVATLSEGDGVPGTYTLQSVQGNLAVQLLGAVVSPRGELVLRPDRTFSLDVDISAPGQGDIKLTFIERGTYRGDGSRVSLSFDDGSIGTGTVTDHGLRLTWDDVVYQFVRR